MRNITILLILLTFSLNAEAVYDKSKLNDWKWHAFICKNVAINLSIISQMEAKNGSVAIDTQESGLKSMIAKSVYEREKEVSFDQQDALFIADITFAARNGIRKSGGQLNPSTAINQGFDICTHILDNFDKELRGGNK